MNLIRISWSRGLRLNASRPAKQATASESESAVEQPRQRWVGVGRWLTEEAAVREAPPSGRDARGAW